MFRSLRNPLWAAMSLVLAAGAASAAGGPPGGPEADDPNVRRKGMEEWLYETKWNASYRRFMNDAARVERERYGNQIPQAQPLDLSGGTALNGALTAGVWANIGPTNADSITNGGTLLGITDSGRPTAIVQDPSNAATIYLATAGGGVWKTTTSGTSWAPITEALGSLSVGHLAMDPNNSNTLYLGMGDTFDGTGVGLYKTTDGGASWTGPVYMGNSTATGHLLVCPSNSNIVLAGTNTGLFRSTDGGAIWNEVTVGGLADPMVWDLVSTGPSSVVLSMEAAPLATTGTTDGRSYRSADCGATWSSSTGLTKSGGIGRVSIAAAPSTYGSANPVLYAMAAVPLAASTSDLADFFRSSNGGATWTALGATANKIKFSNTNTETPAPKTVLRGQGWYNHALIVNPTNANQFFFGGALLLGQATSTNGTTWTYTQKSNWLKQFGLPYVHADFHTASWGPSGQFFVGTDGGIFKSTDNGTTWTDDLNVGISSHLIYTVGSSPANVNAVVGGFQDNGTRVRSGGTGTFNQPIGGDGFGSHIHRTNAQNMLGSLYYSRVYKSTNGGTSFVQSTSGITEAGNSSSAPFNTHIAAYEGDATGNTVFTHTNLKMYKSTNYASSWTAVSTTGLPTTSFVIRNIGVSHNSATKLGIVGSGGRVYLTSTGTNWTLAATPPNSDLSMNSVAFDRAQPSTVYVSSVAPNASASHLWRSDNFGTSWVAIDTSGSGFPQGVPVNAVSTDPVSSSTIYAATHLGLYKSTDRGASWTRFGSGLPLVNVTDLYVSPTSDLVRVSTFGRGFWEMTP